MWKLCPTSTPSIKRIQADHAIDINHWTRTCLNSFSTKLETKLQHKTQKNFNRLNYKMFYQSVIIYKNRIFSYFQNEEKKFKQYNINDSDNSNKKNNNSEKKRRKDIYIYIYNIILNLALFEINLA